MAITTPPLANPRYSHQLPGVYGQFGTGAGVRAFYLQSALTPAQLDWISPISDIRGSERWPVRDLFHRDVDNERVSGSLLPYLQDEQKIKFFNPLTLTLLPVQDNSDRILAQMPRVVESSMQRDGHEWDLLERSNYHRIRCVKDNPHYAVLEWSDLRTKLVAIDGQHRLSALKRFWNDHESVACQNFRTWHIPVVIVSFRVGADEDEPASVLEVVRSIFVYINTGVRKVNRAREILLSDESVNAVCTQELLQLAHLNDLLSSKNRNPCRLPLLFYDWRGEVDEKQGVHAPASLKSIEEIHDWFEHYILGEDFSDDQETALGINPSHPLHGVFYDRKLDHADSNKLREMIQQDLLLAVSYLLENFTPYRSYVEALRKLEREYENQEQSDPAGHAFHELRFGANLSSDSIKPEVERLLVGVKEQIESLKNRLLHKPVNIDIGMRGVVCAFGELRSCFGNPEWMEYAEWFVCALNLVYENDWIDLRFRAKRRSFLLHIIEDHNEIIVNYRLEDASEALGAYLQLLVTAYGQPLPKTWRADEWPEWKESCLEMLRSRVLRGYKKQVRAQLGPEYPKGGKPLTAAVNREAEKLAGRQIRGFERKLDRICRPPSGH